MIRMLIVPWIIGIILCWAILFVHNWLVEKYQPEQKRNSRAYKRENLIVGIVSIIPLMNFILFIKMLRNIIFFKVPDEDKEDSSEV